MKNLNQYFFEYLFIAATILLSIAGFWRIYFGVGSSPTPYHHLHVATNFIWLFLLLYQLNLIRKRNYRNHRKVGLAALIVGPLLIATTALLTVHSAHKGLVSGRGDALIVQNVMVTLELGTIIVLAFFLRKRRKLHGYLMLSSALLFMGIALFFTLLSFVPAFKIEGPETFYRFGTAAATSSSICVAVGFLFFIRDLKNGWILLATGSLFFLNVLIESLLLSNNLIQPLTEFVGSMNLLLTFLGSLAILFALLLFTGMQNTRQPKET